MMTDLSCRNCGRDDRLTYIYRADDYGSLQRHSALCRGGCYRPFREPARRQERQEPPERQEPGGNQQMRSAKYPGKCPACSHVIIPGDMITWTRGNPVVHLECSEN
jgi:hypothetical protein